MANAAQTANLPFSLETLNQLTPNQKVGGVLALAFALALLVGSWMWSRNVEYSVLFANVSAQDGGQIVTSLQQMNVPYQFSEGGGAIMVPAAQVHDIRLRLASQGLPKGGLVGFEVMESQKLGASQFLEQVNYQRALEGELARSIQSLQAVQAARVHLAIPKSSAFLRDEQKPTASVLVNLHPGRALEAAQVAGIVHLVASSVPQLTPANISVVDQNGNLISQSSGSDAARNAGLDPSQLSYLRAIEQSTIRRIEAILEPIVGTGNVRAQVAADIDFSQTEQMAESYAPNPTANAAIRSQQTAESGMPLTAASGVPGALSNQPPVPATAPLTAPNVAGAAGNTAGSSANMSRNATINYELDKTIRHTKGSGSVVKRLSVAVVVNHKKGPPDKEGKAKLLPLSATELQQINELAREAMGFNKERGDTLNVANASFSPVEAEVVDALPLWKDPMLLAMARESVKYIVVAVLALLLWRRILQPLFMAWMSAAEEKRRRLELENQAVETEHATAAPQREYDTKLANARDLAKQDPKMVANVIKDWVSGNE